MKDRGEDILKGLDLTVYEGEIFCILGGNGSGKTTALSVAAGVKEPIPAKSKSLKRQLKNIRAESFTEASYRFSLRILSQYF